MRVTESNLKNYQFLIVITLLGFLLRFIGLGEHPLFIDEALFGFFIQSPMTQEFTTVFIGKLFNLHTEFELRLLSAIAGVLTIPAVYWVLKDKSMAIWASLFVAVCPLFVFWSRMARPYSFAGLFVVLGWRYAWCYLVAIATTPISLVGVRVVKQNKYVLLSALVIAVTLFLIREDSGRNWTIDNALQSSRFFYIPSLAIVLYIFEFRLYEYFDRFYQRTILFLLKGEKK